MSATGRKVISGCTSAVSEVFMRPSLVSCCQEPQSKLTDPAINYQPVPHLESCFHKVKLQQNQTALGLKDEMQFPLASQHLPDKVLRGQIKPAREVYCQTKTQLLPTQNPPSLQPQSCSAVYLLTVRVSSSVQPLILFCASRCVMLSVFTPSMAMIWSPIHKLAIAALLPGVT